MNKVEIEYPAAAAGRLAMYLMTRPTEDRQRLAVKLADLALNRLPIVQLTPVDYQTIGQLQAEIAADLYYFGSHNYNEPAIEAVQAVDQDRAAILAAFELEYSRVNPEFGSELIWRILKQNG